MENISLGDLLRETRIKLGLDLEAVAEGTRISPKNLRAIEESNFAALPAEVFTRGFYTLYAKCLALDPAEVLEMYGRERKKLPKDSSSNTPPPYRLAQNMKNLADPPSSLPFAYLGFMLLLILIFGAFLCWYFSWNPASYLSMKLRSLDTAGQVELAAAGSNHPAAAKSLFAAAQNRKTSALRPNLLNLSSPSMATAATSQPEELRESLPSSGTTKYHVQAIFQEETKVSLAIDDNPQRTLTFKKGEQVSWHAIDKLIITLPQDSKTKISLNEIPIELPKAGNDSITLAIPEYLLR
jgi:cytoskeletal protein RodZ